jgi:hypothetical protein
MSDCCSVQIHIYAPQVKLFQKLTEGKIQPTFGTWDDPPEPGCNFIEIEDDCVNYAAIDQLMAAAEAGVIFTGSNGAGGEYGNGAWCGIGGKYYEVICTHDGSPCVTLDYQGRISAAALGNAQSYIDAHERVEEIFEHGNDSGNLKDLAAKAMCNALRALALRYPLKVKSDVDRMECLG